MGTSEALRVRFVQLYNRRSDQFPPVPTSSRNQFPVTGSRCLPKGGRTGTGGLTAGNAIMGNR